MTLEREDHMKNKILPAIFSLLAAALLTAVLPTEADAEIYSDTLRLHILAASDSEEDQALKIKVRDAILAEYSAALSDSEGLSDTILRVEELLPAIEETAMRVIKECGLEYGIEATISDEWYDTRDYDGFSLPRGKYASLVIKIGKGEGKNWWCVMYPPMCLGMALDAPRDDFSGGYTDSELSLISGGKYRVKFKLLEMISDFID